MKCRFVEVDVLESRNMKTPLTLTIKYWFNKTSDKRMHAAGTVAFREPNFFKNKLDRTIFSTSKRPS